MIRLVIVSGILLLVGLVLYFKPIRVWKLDYTINCLKTLDTMSEPSSVYVDFEEITRAKLCFLLRGIYVSEIAEFSKSNHAFPLTLLPITNGHVAFDKESRTLFAFFRASKTVNDFATDLMLYKTPCTRGGACFAGPSRLAKRAGAEIRQVALHEEATSIVLTGASLGASIAAIAADELLGDESITNSIDLISFSSFGVGDIDFARRMSRCLRHAFYIRNINDAVSAGFNARIGIPILFDYDTESATDAHCSMANMIKKIGEDEVIQDKSFYFSDE